jgi:hypothetical protein
LFAGCETDDIILGLDIDAVYLCKIWMDGFYGWEAVNEIGEEREEEGPGEEGQGKGRGRGSVVD